MKIKNTSGITVKIHIYDKDDAVRVVAKKAFLLNNGEEKTWSGTAASYVVTVFKPAFLDEYLTHRLMGKNDTMEIKSAAGGSVFGHIGSTVTDSLGRLEDTADTIVATSAAILKSAPGVLEAEWNKAEDALGSEWDRIGKTVEGWADQAETAFVQPVSEVVASEDAKKVLDFLANITTKLSDMADEFNSVLTNAARFAMNPEVVDCVISIAKSEPMVKARGMANKINIGGGVFIGVTMRVEGVSQFAVGATGKLEIGYAYFFEGPEKDNVLGLANFSGGPVFGPPGGDGDFGLTVGFIDKDLLSYPLFVVVDGQIVTKWGGLGVNYLQGLPLNIFGGPAPTIEKFGDGAALSGYALLPTRALEVKLSLAAGYLWAWARGSEAKAGRGAASGETLLSDYSGWSDISNYSTIQTAAVDDKLYLLARANNGIDTWLWNGNIWIQTGHHSPALSDRSGWKVASNYSTIQTAVVDHTLYLLARADNGMWTWRLDGNDWVQVRTANPPWTDPEWGDIGNYSTIQTAVVNDTLYLLGMSDTGMETWKLTGSDWSLVSKRDPIDERWRYTSNFSTLQAAPAGNRLYLVARKRYGISTWRLDRDNWVQVDSQSPGWSTAAGWSVPKYYSTIKLVPVGSSLFLLGRANGGIHTWYLDKNPSGEGSWTQVQSNKPPWSDVLGWRQERFYSTIRATALGDSLYMTARASSGIQTWRLSNSSATSRNRGWTQVDSNNPPWRSHPGGWEDPSNNHTLQLTAAGGKLYLLGRADSGLHMWQLNNSKKWERVY